MKLRIKEKGEFLQRLDRTGRVKVRAVVTFTPTGGTPNAQGRPIVLKKKL